ncbi:PAS domain-containing protein [Mycobacterium sp. Marseille-P9652]|uniref:PAS domain-containing protein n=1 Tax=Mycobacterium sp. Marseille-P9652 TaxID=2654950 RepID=UPI0018D1D2AE|nr:PAS domain-containing protein [Mycobacterium sp. Marseille-P9652]
MLSVRQVSAVEASAWFQTRWAPYLLLDHDLRIRAVNAAYERVTQHPRESLVGLLLPEAFPDNPANPEADGVAKAVASIERVWRRGTRHWMGVQRHDAPDRQHPGEFVYRVWTPVHSPIKEDRKTVGILHHVEDVTRAVPQGAGRELTALRRAAEVLAEQFPTLPAAAVLSVLTHSLSTVMEDCGAPDFRRAEALARLRLEARAGRPAADS